MTTIAIAESDVTSEPIIGIWDHELRHQVLPFTIDVVPNLLPIGVTVLYADPGLGKSMLSQAIEHGLGHGQQFGPWLELDPQRCLIIDLEGDPGLTQERGFALTPWGMVETDRDDYDPETWDGSHGIFHLQDRRTGDFGITGRTIAERYIELDRILIEAAEDGKPYGYVRIDTMRDFIGSKPTDTNAYDWDKTWVTELNRLAKRHNVAMLLLHHTNKSGLVSGSQGISAAGECTISLKLNPESTIGECLLKSEKTRRGAPFEYALRMDSEGVWRFDPSLTPTQINNVGLCRQIVDILAGRGPRATREIRSIIAPFGIPAMTLKSALGRLQRRGEIRTRHGMWELVAPPEPPAPGPRMGRCTVCNERMIIIDPTVTEHPSCAPTPVDGEPELPEPVEPEMSKRWSGTRALVDAVDKSKFHPINVIRKVNRGNAPWSLFTEMMDGHFRWQRDSETLHMLPAADHSVATLDRNGSYPSVCNSVTVAANVLNHSGALNERGRTAGLYLIDPPNWERWEGIFPHPLGRTAGTSLRKDGRILVTTPHLILLEKLSQRIDVDGERTILGAAPVIWDSWTGLSTTSLFEPFADEVRRERAAARARSEEDYIGVKRSSSIAIRGLWPKEARSPFWRPDWHLSIKAEAAARLWARAYAVFEAGTPVLRVGKTDELDVLAPLGADETWCPEPLTLGTEYGQFKHKSAPVAATEYFNGQR